ncbi:hypothetical protein FACS1894126_6330 [Alphaproteobacteria bacterium]|nr:hypothetical protein FACS1894126_6330 [Alphaproteobacteria bacterium]
MHSVGNLLPCCKTLRPFRGKDDREEVTEAQKRNIFSGVSFMGCDRRSLDRDLTIQFNEKYPWHHSILDGLIKDGSLIPINSNDDFLKYCPAGTITFGASNLAGVTLSKDALRIVLVKKPTSL